MDEFQVQAVRKRIFNRFTQWYYQGIEPTMDSLDAPEIVALLQSAGFTLSSIGFGASNNVKHEGNNGGCRVIVECPKSGVRAELNGPASALCRCTRFSGCNKDTHNQNVQEQASFWHITTSQERLNVANSGNGPELGSSLLPTIEPARQAVIREVIQLLQEELSASPIAARSEGKRHRLSTSSMSSINNSLESTHVLQPLSDLQIDSSERRASISRCENIPRGKSLASELTSLTPRSPPSWETVISSSSLTVSSEAINTTFDVASDNKTQIILKNLKTIINTATEALSVIDPATKPASKVALSRKATYNVAKENKEVKILDNDAITAARKKPRFVPTPAPRSFVSKVDTLRNSRAPKPNSSPLLGKPPAGTPTTDPIRRRTYNVTTRSDAARNANTRLSEIAVSNSEQAEAVSPTVHKVSKPVSLLKRLSNSAHSKKKQPDGK